MSIQVSTRIDAATKQQFDSVCERIGVTPSNALSMFIKGVINFNGIPFNVVAPAGEMPKSKVTTATAFNAPHEVIEPKPINRNLAACTTPEEKKATMQSVRELMAGIDGDIDLKQLRAERRAAKYERDN